MSDEFSEEKIVTMGRGIENLRTWCLENKDLVDRLHSLHPLAQAHHQICEIEQCLVKAMGNLYWMEEWALSELRNDGSDMTAAQLEAKVIEEHRKQQVETLWQAFEELQREDLINTVLNLGCE